MPVFFQGVYVKAKKGESLLGQLGHVLDEIPAEPSASTAAVMTNGQIAAAAQAVHEQTVNGEYHFQTITRFFCMGWAHGWLLLQ